MLVVLNDIAFNFKFQDKYAAINNIKQLIEIVAELRKIDPGFKVSACCRLSERELAEGYPMAKLFSEPEGLFQRKYKSAFKTFFLNPNIINEGKGEIEYKDNLSKQCAYAYENSGFLLSLISEKEFKKEKIECNYCIEEGKEKVLLGNVSHTNHIDIHRHELPVRKYEFNPKHKVNGGWGSEMDLTDEEAQRVLNEAIVAKDDPKHLIAKYDGKYYSFRLHQDIYYHGYRDDSMPQSLRDRLKNK